MDGPERPGRPSAARVASRRFNRDNRETLADFHGKAITPATFCGADGWRLANSCPDDREGASEQWTRMLNSQ